MRSKTYMSKIYLQRGKLTVENRKSRERKRICSEVSGSPGNPWSQSRRRNGRLCQTVSYHLKNQFDTQYHIVHDNDTYSLEKLDSINDLGVIFDTSLSFKDNISHKINKAYSILGIIKRSLYLLPLVLQPKLYSNLSDTSGS